MDLVNVHIETERVASLATFYARLLDTGVPVIDYYVEIPAGPGTRPE